MVSTGMNIASFGVYDELLEGEVLALHGGRPGVAFWDADAPATPARVRGDQREPLRDLIPRYDIVFTYGGGPPVTQAKGRPLRSGTQLGGSP